MAEVDEQLAAIVQARVGERLCGGKYTIEHVLGIGGMAAVYAGVHRNGRPVAMKLLHPEYSRRADIRKRFLREGQAANAVQHRGVVAVIDDDVAEDGAAFVVMERLEGNTLEQLWEQLGRRFPARAVLAIARELCEVLAVAHRAGIIHRDLKPENLFLTSDGELKVLDFGLAQVRDAARPTETQTGMVFGTPAFMPPEQASGQTSKIDARTDLWAVGATMFTLLSGELVHRGETAQHFVLLAATEPARSLAVAMPNAHPALVALVDRALAREKERRWQSADSMREAIVSLSEMLLGEPAPPLMTPRALLETRGAAGARRAKESPKPAVSSDESTLARPKYAPAAELGDETQDDNVTDDRTVQKQSDTQQAVAVIDDSSADVLDDPTRVGAPAFALASDGPDTEPNVQRSLRGKLPRLGGGSSGPSEETSSDDLATQLRQMPEPSTVPGEDMRKRAGWSDLRHAVEQAKSREAAPDSAEPATQLRRPVAPPAERALDRTQMLRSSGRLANAPPVRPSSPSLPPFAQNRGSSPALLPMPRGAPRTIHTRGPREAPIPYVPLVLAAFFLGVTPLAYLVARSCGGTSTPEEHTLPHVTTTSAPLTPVTAPTVRASAPTTAVEARPVASHTGTVPLTPAATPTAPIVLPPNPYAAPAPQPRPAAPSPDAPDLKK